jgi:hypothetical protein
VGERIPEVLNVFWKGSVDKLFFFVGAVIWEWRDDPGKEEKK